MTNKFKHLAQLNGEERILAASPQVTTDYLQPDMSAPEVTEHRVEAINGGKFDVIICNYANCDMVGHTGNMQAAVQAVEALDAAVQAVEALDGCLQKVVGAIKQAGGQILLTADHGNIEQMMNLETGQPRTAHTTNSAPLVRISGRETLKDGGNLADIAPTMLSILGIPQPLEMTGSSLI
ncbi:MAG: hypothetical protein ABSB19_07715 [Methylomonas sp.]|jgi:2,3-bisphosphoglycerate-independent phosphoglycerate mutase